MWWLALIGCVPDLPTPAIDAAAGDVERGAYLANHVAVCASCHSQRDWRYLYAPNTDGHIGAGSGSTQVVESFPDGAVVWTRNITPTALGDWSDGEIARAMTSGLSRDGTPLFLNMPYDQFGKMASSDVASVVAWVRTLEPQPDEVPDRVLPFPLGIVVRFMPLEAQMPAAPPPPGTPAYGEYLATMASCVWCHSPVDDRSVVIEGQELQGGHPFPVAPPGGGTVYSANLSPDPSGLGSWTKEAFIARFRAAEPNMRAEVPAGGFNTPMPWMAFSGMTDDDLGAIWDWLQTRPPRANTVTKYVPEGA